MNLSAPDADALELAPDLYRQLRKLARSRLRGGGRETLLDTTSLVHEAWLRMADLMGGFGDSRSLFVYASRTMRSVIVDFARKRSAGRRGGDACFVTYTGSLDAAQDRSADDILRVHEALGELEAVDPRLARVVEMRWFAGLTEAEIAQALGVSERTVRRDWEKARLLLEDALAG